MMRLEYSHKVWWLLGMVLCVSALAACKSSNGGADGSGTDSGNDDGGNTTDPTDGGTHPNTWDAAMNIDVAALEDCDLQEALAPSTLVAETTHHTDVPVPMVAADADGGTWVAWTTYEGNQKKIYFRHYDASMNPLTEPVAVDGISVHALASSPDRMAMLVWRSAAVQGTATLDIVVYDSDGQFLNAESLVGPGSRTEPEQPFFAVQPNPARLIWTGEQWVAYFAIEEFFANDGIIHQGDTIRFLNADGVEQSWGWQWGCSHSMDLRVAHNGDAVGPLCISDCFPDKGVLFGKVGTSRFGRTEIVYETPDVSCAGGMDSRLGSMLPAAGGFWAIFASTYGRDKYDTALAFVDASGESGPLHWITPMPEYDEGNIKGAWYAGRYLLIAWSISTGGIGSPSEVHALLVDPRSPSQVTVGQAVSLPLHLGRTSDFTSFPNGDVVWATRANNEIRVHRMAVCAAD